MNRVSGFLVLLLLTLTACGQFERGVRTTSPDDIKGFWEKKVPEGEEFTGYTLKALIEHDRGLIASNPADATEFCPTYPMLDQNGRLAFWVALVSGIAWRESSFNPKSSYKEDMKSRDGSDIVSRGLLQISLSSTRAYGCDFKDQDEVHDPQKNLECGVKMLNRLVLKDNRISGQIPGMNGRARYLGAARYWHVMRPTGSLAKIRARMNELEICKL